MNLPFCPFQLRAWTPAGRGLYLRQPPLLPYAADYRNKRIADTAEYTNRPLEDIETFSETQRSVKPKKVVGRNLHVETDQPAQYVSFDLDWPISQSLFLYLHFCSLINFVKISVLLEFIILH